MEQSGLQLIQTAVVADQLVTIFGGLAVIAKGRGLRAPLRIGGEDGAAVAHRAQILGGIKTGGGELAGGAGGLAFIGATAKACADGLGAILDDVHAELLAQAAQRGDIESVTIKMHGDEETDIRAAPEKIAAAVQVEQAALVHIDKQRYRAHLQNRERGGEGGKRRGQHGVAWHAAENLERNFDGVQAAGDSDGVLDAPIRGKRGFELAHFFAQNVPAAVADFAERGHGVFLDVQPLPVEIVGWDHELSSIFK